MPGKNIVVEENIKSSLLLLFSGHEAKWYEVSGNKVNLIVEIKTKKINYSDKEGITTRGGGAKILGGTDLTSDKRRDEEEKTFKKVVEQSIELWSSKKLEFFAFASPTRFKNVFINKISKIVDEDKLKFLAGNFVQLEIGEIPSLFKRCLLAKYEQVSRGHIDRNISK